MVTRLMLGGDSRIEGRNLLWNMLGSLIYALTSMLLGAAVVRLLGPVEGGIFLFAFSTLGQQLYIVSYFGIRPIQATDTLGRYTFGEYRRLRLLTCLSALLLGFAYSLLFSGSLYRLIIWMAMILYKTVDGLADCYESEYQRRGRLYVGGKSIALRTILSIGGFLLILHRTNSLLWGSIFFGPILFVCLLVFAMVPLRSLKEVVFSVRPGKVASLFREAMWLFGASFLDLYIFAAAKYAVDAHLGPEYSSYFSTVFIPTSVINLMAGFVIRPLLTKLSFYLGHGKLAEFQKTILQIGGLILFLTLLGAGFSYLAGIPILMSLLGTAGHALSGYRGVLLVIVLGGGLYALLNLLYYGLVIMKMHRSIFIIYTGTALFALGSSHLLVFHQGVFGAGLSYFLNMALLYGMFQLAFLCGIKKEKERQLSCRKEKNKEGGEELA